MDFGSRRRSGAIHITRSFSVVEGMSWEDMEVDMPMEVDTTQRLRCIADEDSRDTGESSRDSGISACSTSTTLLTDFSALRQESNAMYDMDLEVLKNEQMELSDDDYNTSLKLTGQTKTSSKLTVGSKVIRRPRLALQNITNTKYSRDFGNDSPKSSKYSATRKRSVGTLCKSMNSDHQGTRRNALFTIESDSEEPVCALQRVQSTSVLEMSYSVGYVSSPEPTEHYSLSTVQKPQINDRAFRSIDGITLTKLMLRFGEEEFNRHYLLVDCRYPYEYNGGHIKLAINMYDTSEVGKVFYPSDVEQFEKVKNKIPIFYCEYSQKRGPSMARALRRLDRSRNIYPKLDYREIYVLDRGYRKFFNDGHESFCQPSSYMPMDNENHTEDLKKYRFHKSKTYSGTSLSSSRSFRRLEFFPTDS